MWGYRAWVPCLLHAFWFIHALHSILAIWALRLWLDKQREDTAPPQPWNKILWCLLPWIGLTLLFWVPGVYLEFPSDPWQHYARINEWSWLQTVTEHSFWKKSSYYLAYSLIGQLTPPVLQLKWFEVYYTSCCLLLCWQYYRLARTVGLSERASFLFVLLQALLSGNDLFGFYRYYGMASTIFAQLGAVALIRVVLEALRPCVKETGTRKQEPRLSVIHRSLVLVVSFSSLLSITAFNHVQGVGIAAFGLMAVVVWRLIVWRRSMVYWLGSAALILSTVTLVWWPQHPLVETQYHMEGWFSPWMGFNLFAPTSPAFDRATHITGILGIINLLAGLWLLRLNHVVGWLTVTPVILMCLPFVVIPFSNMLAADTSLAGGYIIAFHRMFFSIPAGLALTTVFLGREANEALLCSRGSAVQDRIRTTTDADFSRTTNSPYALLIVLSILVLLPAGNPYFNRLYNVLMVAPEDLSMRHVIISPEVMALTDKGRFPNLDISISDIFSERGNILTTPEIGYVMNTTGSTLIAGTVKWMTWPTVSAPSLRTKKSLENLNYINIDLVVSAQFPPIRVLYSSISQTGLLSKHWLPSEVALGHATQQELFINQARQPKKKRAPQIWLEWFGPDDGKHNFSNDVRTPIESDITNDRGFLPHDGGRDFRQADQLILRPVLRTPDGNGYSVTISIEGPNFHSRQDFIGRPNPLGGEGWIFGDQTILLRQPGVYSAQLTAVTFWPQQSYSIKYRFTVYPNDD